MRPSFSAGGGGTIDWNNKADLDMAIADLYHAKSIPFNIGESDIFRKVVTLARTVGPDYCPPNCNIIGGALLDLNCKSCRIKTTKYLMDELGVSGLAFLGDLVMIKGCPIIKIITSSFNVPVSILGVKYCSKHLAQGGNKDVTFISNL